MKRKQGQCWIPKCEKKYVVQIKFRIDHQPGCSSGYELRACKEHFRPAWEDEFKATLDKFLKEPS